MISAIRNSPNLRNLTYMLAGNFGAQGLSLLFYPLLVRIFSPEDFGVFGTFSSFMVIAGVFASGQLHMAFIKCPDSSEIKELLWLSRRFMLAGTLVATLIVVLVNLRFHYFTIPIVMLFPFALWFYLNSEASKMMGVRNQHFKNLSHATSGNRLGSNVFKLVLGKISVHPISLIVSDILANFLSALYLRKSNEVEPEKPRDPWALLRKFSHFPKYASFSNFFQWGLLEFPVVLLSIFYDKSVIGLYVLTIKIVLQPLVVVGNSIGSVLSRKMVFNHLEKSTNYHLLIKLYGSYLVLGGLAFGLIFFLPESFFALVLGSKWAGIKDVLVPMTLLCTAKISSGLHIYIHIAEDATKVKSAWKAAQLGVIIVLILVFKDLPFTHLLWIICSVEAGVDFLFTGFTVLSRRRIGV